MPKLSATSSVLFFLLTGYIDADLVMWIQVMKTVSRCFAALRRVRQVRRCVRSSMFQSLLQALVISRLDYGNGVIRDLPIPIISDAAATVGFQCGSAVDL